MVQEGYYKYVGKYLVGPRSKKTKKPQTMNPFVTRSHEEKDQGPCILHASKRTRQMCKMTCFVRIKKDGPKHLLEML